MRRQDREITDINEKMKVIKKCKICKVGLSENNMPYIVPLNYGYEFCNNELTLFFHSAMEGKKLDIIKNNNNACFEIDCDTRLIESEQACNFGFAFKSIIGFGSIVILDNPDEKEHGLNMIMKHQTDNDTAYKFSPEQINHVCVFKMAVENFTGKHKEFPQR